MAFPLAAASERVLLPASRSRRESERLSSPVSFPRLRGESQQKQLRQARLIHLLLGAKRLELLPVLESRCPQPGAQLALLEPLLRLV